MVFGEEIVVGKVQDQARRAAEAQRERSRQRQEAVDRILERNRERLQVRRY
jgi:hypothetical protein